MKPTILTLLLFLAGTAISQDFSKYNKEIELEDEQDYYDSEPEALECAEYIMSNPPSLENSKIRQASKFMIDWMSGSPYSFELWSWGVSLAKKETALLGNYMASLLIVGLKDELFESEEAQLGAAKLMYDYVKNPKYIAKPKGPIKKFIKACDKGEMKSFVLNG